MTTRSITFLYIFNRESQPKPLFTTGILGHTQPKHVFFPFLFLKDDLLTVVNLISTSLDDFLDHLPEVCRGEMDALSYCLELGV